MGDHIAKAQDFEKKAEKKLSGWGIFGSKYEDAADLFDKAANSFKLAKSCDFPLPPSLDSHPTQSRNSRESELEMETRKRKPFSNITNIQNLTPLSVLRELVVSNGISKPATSILKPISSSTNHELCPEASDPSNTSIGSCSVGATFNWKNVRFRHPPLAISSHTSPTCSRIQSIENSKKERAAHAVVCTPIEKKDKVKAITLPFSSSSSEKTKDTQNKICKLDLTDGGVGIQKAVRFSSSKENHSDFRSETTKTSRKETESGVIACHSPIMKRKDKGKAIAVPYSSSPIQEQDTHNNVCNSSIQVEGQCKKDVENLGFSSGTVENVQGIHLYGHISGKADKGEANLNSSGRALEKILETGKDISDTSCRLLEKRTEKKKGILKHIISSSSQTNEMGKVFLNPSNSLAREAKDRGKSAATSNSLPEKTKGKRNVVLEPYNTGGSSSAVTVESRSSRKTSEKNKNAVGVSSCPPMTRSKRMLRDIDEAGDLNCSKSWTAPQAKTRKRVCWKTKETSAWPEDFIREQKSYFDEVDNFELAVEEVSQDELE